MFWNKLVMVVLALFIRAEQPPEPVTIREEIVIQQEIEISEPLEVSTTTEEVVDNIACYCSRFAKKNGVDIPNADAKDLKASSTPEIGGGILFEYGNTTEENHIAVIKAFLKEGFFVEEANKEPCKITTRVVKYNDFFIRGFINKK